MSFVSHANVECGRPRTVLLSIVDNRLLLRNVLSIRRLITCGPDPVHVSHPGPDLCESQFLLLQDQTAVYQTKKSFCGHLLDNEDFRRMCPPEVLEWPPTNPLNMATA